jgi:polyisoprenoid-binding protein YceI
MRKFIYTTVVLLFTLASVANAQLYSVKKGSIYFRSDAPLELITAKSDELRGKFDVSKKMFAFAVNITSFAGFNSPLQKEHFNENYMESNLYPTASFSGKIIEDINFTTDGTYSIRAKGNLTVHGVVQERIIKVELTIKDGKINVASNFTVLLSEHNIPIPKVVHEKLASEIKVEVKAELAAS